MDLLEMNSTNFFGYIGGILVITFAAIKYLITYNYQLKMKIKEEEAKNIDHRLTSLADRFERDIVTWSGHVDGLGSKLRGFKGVMEGFQNTVAQVGINHAKIDLKIQQLEVFNQTLDKKIQDQVHFEFLKMQKIK